RRGSTDSPPAISSGVPGAKVCWYARLVVCISGVAAGTVPPGAGRIVLRASPPGGPSRKKPCGATHGDGPGCGWPSSCLTGPAKSASAVAVRTAAGLPRALSLSGRDAHPGARTPRDVAEPAFLPVTAVGSAWAARRTGKPSCACSGCPAGGASIGLNSSTQAFTVVGTPGSGTSGSVYSTSTSLTTTRGSSVPKTQYFGS